MATSEAGLVEQLVKGLTEALKQSKPSFQRPIKLSWFSGRPAKPGDPTVKEWLEEVDIYCRQCRIPESEKAQVVINHLKGTARDEIKCHSESGLSFDALGRLLHKHFGGGETFQSLHKAIYDRYQGEHETLMDFSRELIRLYDRILEIAPAAQKDSLKSLKDKALISQFVAGARGQSTRLELRRLELENPSKSFIEIRDLALEMFRDVERTPKARATQVRHVRSDQVQGSVEDYESAEEIEEICVNKIGTQSEQGQQTQEKILKSIQEMQGQIAKQQGQIDSLVNKISQLHLPDRGGNVTTEQPPSSLQREPVRCFRCKKLGHIKAQCRVKLPVSRNVSEGNSSRESTQQGVPVQHKQGGEASN